jgi:hypothetical protein
LIAGIRLPCIILIQINLYSMNLHVSPASTTRRVGDSQHHRRFDDAYENAPQSLRDVEETTGFKA